MNEELTYDCEYRILCSLRRIIRSVDIYSRKLNNELGLTTPQLLCLHALKENENSTLSDVAKAVNLGASTVNGIVDRLEAKKLVVRHRSQSDRRKVYLEMTDKGVNMTQKAPKLLQDKLSKSFSSLSTLEQLVITQSLERIVELMDVEEVKASPNLLPTADVLPK